MNLATYCRLLLSALLCLPVMLQAAPLASRMRRLTRLRRLTPLSTR